MTALNKKAPKALPGSGAEVTNCPNHTTAYFVPALCIAMGLPVGAANTGVRWQQRAFHMTGPMTFTAADLVEVYRSFGLNLSVFRLEPNIDGFAYLIVPTMHVLKGGR